MADKLIQRALRGWPLFWLFVLPMTGCMLAAMAAVDMSSPEGVSSMIQYSVRWAVPFIFFVTAASALPALFPNRFTRWGLRNRRIIGLVFAAAMAWQGAFIFIMSFFHGAYYYADVYLLRDELEGSCGYLFLFAMVLTSFPWGRRRVSPAQWKTLHRSGVYFLWAYAYSVYWWNVFFYDDPLPIDYLFYTAGFCAFALRIAAWGKRRAPRVLQPGRRLLGGLVIAAGLGAAATGMLWQAIVSTTLTAPTWSANLELWLPFWPFEPFLPLAAIGMGTYILSGANQDRSLAPAYPEPVS